MVSLPILIFWSIAFASTFACGLYVVRKWGLKSVDELGRPYDAILARYFFNFTLFGAGSLLSFPVLIVFAVVLERVWGT